MTDQLLNVLKVAFLALLYLFFLRVLWVVGNEVRGSRAGAGTPTVAAHPAQATQLADPTINANAPVPAPVAPPPPLARRKPPKGRRGGVGRLVIIQPKARRGSSYAVGHELTLGRAPGCTVQITDDAFISNLHARVFVTDDGVLLVEDLGSTNGTYLNGERLAQPRPMRKGDRVQLGNTVLEAQ